MPLGGVGNAGAAAIAVDAARRFSDDSSRAVLPVVSRRGPAWRAGSRFRLRSVRRDPVAQDSADHPASAPPSHAFLDLIPDPAAPPPELLTVTTAAGAAASTDAVTLTTRVWELPPPHEGPRLPASLQVSIVTWRPDMRLLERCFRKLVLAIEAAREDGTIRTVALAIIDNSEDPIIAQDVMALARARFRDAGLQLSYLHGHANIGYGAAHNLVLHGSGADYHLVLNPDVELAPDALANAVRWLAEHDASAAAAPAVRTPTGEPDFLARRYPAIFDLVLRGFAPAFLRRLFRRRLDRYELRDYIDPDSEKPIAGLPVVSGACMLVKRKAIDATGGFDPRYFLYFEDYDWSVRLAKTGQLVYLPSFRVVHHGGGAARKGAQHVYWFVRSGVRFYRKHGWRFF